MKDRNGKILREGDVCVIYEQLGPLDEGSVVEFYRESRVFPGECCVRPDSLGITLFLIRPEQLEIIGDVR